MARVLILGSNGMLGSMVSRVLIESGHDVITTDRDGSEDNLRFRVGSDSVSDLLRGVPGLAYVINAIGIIKPRINESSAASRQTAIEVNGLFPYELAGTAEGLGVQVIQIATDCVYSGDTGMYTESDLHDPTDVYGKSKSLGEVPSPSVLHLRASIIGPEVGRQTSLWEWVRGQPANARINGFTNHRWNGVTTYHFGRVCAGLIGASSKESGVRHLVPGDIVTKASLVRDIAAASHRTDISVNDVEAQDEIDRTLSSDDINFSSGLWELAGYSVPPTVSEMVHETPLD